MERRPEAPVCRASQSNSTPAIPGDKNHALIAAVSQWTSTAPQLLIRELHPPFSTLNTGYTLRSKHPRSWTRDWAPASALFTAQYSCPCYLVVGTDVCRRGQRAWTRRSQLFREGRLKIPGGISSANCLIPSAPRDPYTTVINRKISCDITKKEPIDFFLKKMCFEMDITLNKLCKHAWCQSQSWPFDVLYFYKPILLVLRIYFFVF